MIEGLFQPVHLILILALVLMFFGPGKLAELGSSLGKGLRELKSGLEDADATPPAQAPSQPTDSSTPPG